MMKKNLKRTLCLLLALALALSLFGCAKQEAKPAPEAASVTVNVMTLNGTTGFGMAGLMHNANAGSAEQSYSFSVETDASNITAALISGSVDIAALPTNAASVVGNKTNGAVQALALNTRGVLYLVSDGSENIVDMSSLQDKTVYVPAQNPSFIMEYLCKAYELGDSVTIDNTYAQPAELTKALAAGQVHLAVLPEPMVSMTMAQNENLQAVLDLTALWDQVAPEGSLVQGCVVVRKAFAEEHPDQVALFLKEYEASIALCAKDPEKAADDIVECGIFTNREVALKALPRCNLCFVTGQEMKTALSQYLELMAQVNAQSVGGQVPSDDFYYIP